MSTMGPSPALTSRVTPRSTKKWKSSWKSPKSPHPGLTKRSPKASANFRNVPSTPPYRSPQNKGAYSPTPNPKALIDRLSSSTYTGTQRPPSPTKWLDTLMQSEALTEMLSSKKDVPNDASGDMNHDVVEHPSTNTADNTEESPVSPLAKVTLSAAPEDQQPTSPMSSTSAADVDEILRAVPDSDQIDSEIPTAVPNSPVDSPAAVVAAAAPVSLYERWRRLILPLAIQNARARDTNGDSAVESERVEQQVMTSMTDEICAYFMGTAKEMKEQMAALKKDSDGGGDGIVGAKRPRDEEYPTERSVTRRVRLDSDGAASATTTISPPRAPKAMIQTKQNEVLGKFMPMTILHADSNAPVSPTGIKRATPPPSQQPKCSGRPPTSDRRESDYDMDTDIPGRRRDHEGVIEHRRDPSYDMDKSKHQRGRSGDKDHVRRDSRYSDGDMDNSKSGRWDFGDVDTRQLNSGRKDSRYADSDLDKLDRRRRDRSDKEWDYVRDHRDSDSSSRKHSSSGSSRRRSDELLASRMSDPGVPTSTKTSTHETSSTGSNCRVPGLWFVKVGLNHMDVVNMSFEVDAEVASRCCGPNASNIAVRLVCLPTASVEEMYKQLDPAASPEVVTDAMRSVKPEWPPKGKIIVQVNPGTKVGRSWLPQELDPAKSILELTAHIQLGQNNIRLIHLGDLSAHTFLLHAAEAQPSLPAGPTPKPILSKDLFDSDWENYIARLPAIKHSDIRGDAFKFAGMVAVEAQTV